MDEVEVYDRRPTPMVVNEMATKPRTLREEFSLTPTEKPERDILESKLLLVPIIHRTSHKKSKTSKKTVASKKARNYARCKNGRRRNKKTHRCNTNCPDGFKKNVTNKRCVKKE
jgi:hypothetical protein